MLTQPFLIIHAHSECECLTFCGSVCKFLSKNIVDETFDFLRNIILILIYTNNFMSDYLVHKLALKIFYSVLHTYENIEITCRTIQILSTVFKNQNHLACWAGCCIIFNFLTLHSGSTCKVFMKWYLYFLSKKLRHNIPHQPYSTFYLTLPFQVFAS